jgi:hypothetical protein
MGHHADHAAQPVVHGTSSDKLLDGKKPATCSACSLCCNLNVLLPTLEVLGASAEHGVSLAFQATPPASPLLTGLRRPPRFLLA